jgi:hypothetical protein
MFRQRLRTFLGAGCVLGLLAALLSGCGGSAAPPGTDPGAPGPFKELWVSTTGSDTNPGTEAEPFESISRAVAEVRALKSPAWTGDVVIRIGSGTYRPGETLTLGPGDSGQDGYDLVFQGATDASSVISGGTRVDGWEIYDAVNDVYRAPAKGLESRQFFVNGTRATRARTTPYPAIEYPVGFLPKFFDLDGKPLLELGIEYILSLANPSAWRDPSTWQNVADIEAVIVTQWKMMTVPLNAIDSLPILDLAGLITIQEPAWSNANIYLSEGLFDKLLKLHGLLDEPGIWSFWQVSRFENALSFLDEPGEWYLDRREGWVYYKPRSDEDLDTAVAELATLETLIDGQGRLDQPITNLRFEGLTFTTATWLGPSSADGYIVDQSGFHVTGTGHKTNTFGHTRDVTRTPGNVRFSYAHDVAFSGNVFTQLGGVALDFNTGSQGNSIEDNLFIDLSAAAIQLGGVSDVDAHPEQPGQITRDNTIQDNLIRDTGRDYVDTPGIFVGFSANTLIQHNTIVGTPWSGIAIGWGWGLLDAGMFPGVPGAESGVWGTYDTPTPNNNNRILNNYIADFIQVVWDGGAIYTTGQQGQSEDGALLISGNVATSKRPKGGGNVIYTDGGTRYVKVEGNALFNNPIGEIYFGPLPPFLDPLPYLPIGLLNGLTYGSDIGGCRTYGDISYSGNYWEHDTFYGPSLCPYSHDGVTYPTNLTYTDNHVISGRSDVPAAILAGAGVRSRAPSIPAEVWMTPGL